MRRAPNSKDERETNVEERKIGLRTELNGKKNGSAVVDQCLAESRIGLFFFFFGVFAVEIG